ncbi:MAG: hypothetical protein HXS46_16965 [Theionarchaea archaeon]|nr:hypothetical protein [Theionarchaea archaeon]
MRLSREQKEEFYRAIYEIIFSIPRVKIYEIARILKIDRNVASHRLHEAFNKVYISKPQIRKRAYANMKEYSYFLRCKNPAELFSEYLHDENIIYHAVMTGFANLWVISKEEIDFDCDVIAGGLRSDYHIPLVPNHSWETAAQIMRKKIQNFNLKDYEPERIIQNHWNETTEWDEEDEKLFKEFNYDLRRPITPIQKKHLISWRKVDTWLQKLPKFCTVFTLYYPKTISVHDPYLFVFETDYEDFLIDLFSELPASSWFFKVSDKLCLYAHVKREYARIVETQSDIRELHIPTLVTELIRKGVLKNEEHSIVECYWNRDP